MYCRNCGAVKNTDEGIPCSNCGAVGGYKFCPHCGAVTPMGSKECPCCHEELHEIRGKGMIYPDKCRLGPYAAAIVSLVLPGLGQMINGQNIKGLVLFLVLILIVWLFGSPWSYVYALVAAADAYTCAKSLRSGQIISEWKFF